MAKMARKSRRFGRSWGAPRPATGPEQRLDEASFCEAGRLRPSPTMRAIWLLQARPQSIISGAGIRFSHEVTGRLSGAASARCGCRRDCSAEVRASEPDLEGL